MESNSSDRLVTVARYDAISMAEVAGGRLEQADIPFHITTGQIPGMPLFYGKGEGAVQLQVPRDRAEEATDVLEDE